MVSGLFIPVVAALIKTKNNPAAAFWSMIAGGGTSLSLIILNPELPFGLDPIIFGISSSLAIFLLVATLKKRKLAAL